MFETEYDFEEIPLEIGTTEFAVCSGTALLEGEIGTQDYGFAVTGIALDGNRTGDYRDKRVARISQRSDDPFCVLLFERLRSRIEADRAVRDHYYHALQDHLQQAA